MSRENVELVLALQPAPDVDVAQMFREDRVWAAASAASSSITAADFDAVFWDSLRGETRYPGADGLREMWLDWTAPWASYRVEVEKAIDLGDRVLLLIRDFGRREGSTHEVMLRGAALWTVRDGKIARAEFFNDRAAALKAVGLEE